MIKGLIHLPDGSIMLQDKLILYSNDKVDYYKKEFKHNEKSDIKVKLSVSNNSFNNDLIEEYDGKPVLLEHIDSSNYKGIVSGCYIKDIGYRKELRGNLIIIDKELIRKILIGEITGISAHYKATLNNETNEQQITEAKEVSIVKNPRFTEANIYNSKGGKNMDETIQKEDELVVFLDKLSSVQTKLEEVGLKLDKLLSLEEKEATKEVVEEKEEETMPSGIANSASVENRIRTSVDAWNAWTKGKK